MFQSNAQKISVRLGLFGLSFGQVNLKYDRLVADNMSLGITVGVLIPHRLKTLENAVGQFNQSDTINKLFQKKSKRLSSNFPFSFRK